MVRAVTEGRYLERGGSEDQVMLFPSDIWRASWKRRGFIKVLEQEFLACQRGEEVKSLDLGDLYACVYFFLENILFSVF